MFLKEQHCCIRHFELHFFLSYIAKEIGDMHLQTVLIIYIHIKRTLEIEKKNRTIAII